MIRLSIRKFVRLLTKLCHRILAFVAVFYTALQYITATICIIPLLGLLFNLATDGGFRSPKLKTDIAFFVFFWIQLSVVYGSIFVLYFLSWIGHRWKDKKNRLNNAFRLCKSTEELELEDFGFRAANISVPLSPITYKEVRPYYGTYFARRANEDSEISDIDLTSDDEYTENELEQLLRVNKSFFLIGPPLSGKTLTLFFILQRMEDYFVVIPNPSKPIPEESVFSLLKGKKIIIFLDNLSIYAKFNYDIETFSTKMRKVTNNHYVFAGTCRDGGDLTSILTGHGSTITYFCERILQLRLSPLPIYKLVELADTAGMKIDQTEARQYPHPGNITMKEWLQAMQARFNALTNQQQDTLRAIKILDAGGISITPPYIRTVLADVLHRSIVEDQLELILRVIWMEFFLLEQPSAGNIYPHFGHLEYAVKYGENPEVEEEYLKSLSLSLIRSNDVNALMQLAHVYKLRCDSVNILRILDSVINIEPEHPRAHYHRGYALARLGKVKEALKANQSAIEICPTLAEAYNNRAYILSLLEQFDDALDAVDHALKIKEDYDDAHTNRAIVLARLNRFPEAIAEFSEASRINPEKYYIYHNLGITLSRQGFFKDALRSYDKAKALRPNYPELFLNQGITLARCNKFEEALESHDHAISLRPDYAEAYMYCGMTLISLERYPEAIESLNYAIELRPDHALSYFHRGRAYNYLASQEDFKMALSDFDKTIELSPNLNKAHYNRGGVLANLGLLEEAQEAVWEAFRLQPDCAETYCALGYVLSRIRRYDRKHLERILEAYEKSIEIRPTYSEAHRERGYVLGQLGRDEEALGAFDQAIELRPEFASALFGKARSLCFLVRFDPKQYPQKDTFDKVLELLERAVALDTNTIYQINKEWKTFRNLRQDSNYNSRFFALIKKEHKGE